MIRYLLGLLMTTLLLAGSALGQTPPTLTKIDPDQRTDLTSGTVNITLTGSGFTNGMTLQSSPTGVVGVSQLMIVNNTSATATLTLDPNTTVESVNLWVVAADGTTSGPVTFYTGIATRVCLEAIKSGGCTLLWEVDASSATGSSTQSNNNTTPNIVVKLDYQWLQPKNRTQKHLLANRMLQTAGLSSRFQPGRNGLLLDVNALKVKDFKKAEQDERDAVKLLASHGLLDEFTDHLTGHANFETGYTQAVVATKLQPTTGTSCPNGTNATTNGTSPPTCTAATPKEVFLAQLAAGIGVTSAVNGQGTAADFSINGRGAFDYLPPSNKVVQSGGLTYLDLSSVNTEDAVGLYEINARFRVSQIDHDVTMPNGNLQNTSDLLVIEGGYQNNRGLQQIGTTTATNTRNRYVGRFYVNPEIGGTKHTKITMGMEYTGGINGGPHTIQLFFGATLNPITLFGH